MKKILGTIFLVMAFYSSVLSQKRDSIRLIKDFITVSRQYQSPPLQATIAYKKYSNLSVNEPQAFTKTVEAKFVLKDATNGYIRFGDIEQIITDTVVVIVSNDIKRMVVYTGKKEEMQQKMLKLGNIDYKDSVYENWLKVFTVERQVLNGVAEIKMNSKQVFVNSKIPVQTILMEYDTKTQLPQKVKTIKRGLYSLDKLGADTAALQSIVTDKKGKLWVVEEIEAFEFKQINHNVVAELPIKVSDRIILNKTNNSLPATGFEGYKITIHD